MYFLAADMQSYHQ